LKNLNDSLKGGSCLEYFFGRPIYCVWEFYVFIGYIFSLGGFYCCLSLLVLILISNSIDIGKKKQLNFIQIRLYQEVFNNEICLFKNKEFGEIFQQSKTWPRLKNCCFSF